MTADGEPSRGARDLFLLLALALVYRALFLAAMPRVVDTADGVLYLETATHFIQGDFFGYDPKIPLLYPLLGAFAGLLLGNVEWGCMAVSCLASVFSIVPAYRIARAMHGRGPACVAGLILALWPWLADYAWRVGTESLAVCCWLLGSYWLYHGTRRGGWRLWAAPLVFFALHLTRPEGLVMLFAAPAALAVTHWGCCSPRRLLPYALVTLPLLGLNAVYVRMLTGAVTANYRVGFIVKEFDALRFLHTAAATFNDVLPVMLGPVLFLFLGVGFFQASKDRRDARLELFLLLLAATQWMASWFVLSPAPRYLMAPLMALALWSGRGMALTARAATPLPWGRALRLLPVGVMIASMLFHSAVTAGSEHLGRRPRQPREYKAAGLWMREHLEPGLIFCRKPQIGFYAGMPSTGPDLADTLDAALARARAAGARYVVVDERYTAQDAPGLRPLLDPAQAPPSLRFLNRFDLYPESRVIIYALAPDTPPPPPES